LGGICHNEGQNPLTIGVYLEQPEQSNSPQAIPENALGHLCAVSQNPLGNLTSMDV
jgi:hypothetical protein